MSDNRKQSYRECFGDRGHTEGNVKITKDSDREADIRMKIKDCQGV